MPVSISVMNLGCTVSLVSMTFECAFVVVGNTSWGVSASTLTSNSASGSRKLASAIRSWPMTITGPGKHRRSRPLVPITASVVGESSKDSNEYWSDNLLTMSPAFWPRMCNARISKSTQTMLKSCFFLEVWFIRTSIHHFLQCYLHLFGHQSS